MEKLKLGAMTLEGVPKIPFLGDVERYSNSRSCSTHGWLPGAGLLVSTRFGSTRQCFHVARPGGYRQQLTFWEEPVGTIVASPRKGGGIIISRDVGGGEKYQLFHLEVDVMEKGKILPKGEPRQITDGKARYGSPLFSRDGTWLAYYKTQGKNWNVMLGKVEEGNVFHLLEDPLVKGEGAFYPCEFSPSGDRLLVKEYISVTHSRLFVVDVKSKKRIQLVEDWDPCAIRSVAFEGEDHVIAACDYESDFARLVRVRIPPGSMDRAGSVVCCKKRDWDVERVSVSPDARFCIVGWNEDGLTSLCVMSDLDKAQPSCQSLPSLPQGIVDSIQWSLDSKQVSISLNTPVAPGDVFVINVEDWIPLQWTFSELGPIPADVLSTPRLVRSLSFDGLSLPSWYFPAPLSTNQSPVVIYIHGGPESQFRPGWNPFVQFLVSRGIAVVAPNVRGSKGYGTHYLNMDNVFLRENAVKDIGGVLDWIEEQPELDKERVAVFGGSYGGYMVLASLIRFGKRLKCGAEIVGISNFNTFLKNTKDYRRDLRRAIYGDERVPKVHEFLEQVSPLTNAEKIQCPLLVAQGANDPRVPLSESTQLVERVRKGQKEVWLMIASNEGHGFQKKENRTLFRATVAMFFEQFL